MKILNVKNIGGALLGSIMLLGTVMVSGTTTQAQYPYPQSRRERQRQAEIQRQAELQRQAEIERERQQGYGQYGQQGNGNRPARRGRNWDGYGNLGGSYELRQTALNAGYNEGNKAGRNDRRSGRYDPTRASAYRNASKDYNSRMGDRNAYQQYFRAAFENGYSDGYNGY
jgi:hypothetical protein